MSRGSLNHNPIDFLSNLGFKISDTKTVAYEDFKFKFDKPIIGNNDSKFEYQKSLSQKFKEYSKEVMNTLVDRRLEKIIKHYENLPLQKPSTKIEQPPKKFTGPYLPSILHLKALSELDINVSWELSDVHSHTDLKARSTKRHQKGKFTLEETNKLLKRWRKFKRKYDFHDLRPLVAERTSVVTRKQRKICFYSISYLNHTQKRNFLLYMGKKLPDRTLEYIWEHMREKLDWFALESNGPHYGHRMRTSKELNIITAFIRKYGFNTHGLNVVLKKSSITRIKDIASQYHRIVHIPMKKGAWTIEEKEEVIKAVMRQFPGTNLKTILKEKHSISWQLVFQQIQNRPKLTIVSVWNDMKQCLYTALRPKQEDPSWMHCDILKLLKLVCGSGVESKIQIDWTSLARYFPLYVDNQLKKTYNYLYKKNVPEDVEDFASGSKLLYKAALGSTKGFQVNHMRKVKVQAENFREFLLSLQNSNFSNNSPLEEALFLRESPLPKGPESLSEKPHKKSKQDRVSRKRTRVESPVSSLNLIKPKKIKLENE